MITNRIYVLEQNENGQQEYVLILEDRTEVKNKQEAGKLSVVMAMGEKGKLKTTESINNKLSPL